MKPWDPAVWELLFSFVFVLVGSLTFHISSLISGLSIFREYPSHFSTLMALTIGIVLFGISPISFFVLGPYLEQNIVSDTGQIQGIREAISNILTLETILPFLLSASGFGLMTGALVRLQARVKCLDWVRRKTNMQFGIKSYQLSWDAFLSSIKRGGEICVETDKNHIYGRLEHFSIRNEPHAIWLSNYIVYASDFLKGMHAKVVDGEILIRGEELQRVSAPDYSFNKHHDSMRHLSQAFYILLAAVGFFMMATSLDGTAMFLNSERYLTTLGKIQQTYSFGALLLLIIALSMLLIALKVLRNDCKTWRATMDLYPEIITVTAVLASIFVFVIFDMLSWRYLFPPSYKYGVISILVFGTLAIGFYLKQRSKPIKNLFISILLEDEPGMSPNLKDLIDEIYIKMDANKPEEYPNTIIPPKIDKKYKNSTALPKIKKHLDDLFAERQYLRHEIYNLIVKLRKYIQQKETLV